MSSTLFPLFIDSATGSKEYAQDIASVFAAHGQPLSLVRLVRTNSDDFAGGGGDFVFAGNGPDGASVMVGIELKCISDFVQSAVSGDRLGTFQLPNMANVYQELYLILLGSVGIDESQNLTELRELSFPGTHAWKPVRMGQTEAGTPRLMPHSRFIGQLHSLAVGYNLKVFVVPDRKALAHTLYSLWAFWQKPYESHTFTKDRALKSPSRNHAVGGSSNVYWFLSKRIYGMGKDRARAIADAYPTFDKLLAASIKDLQGVQGVGKSLAVKIWNGLRSK